MKKLLKCLKYWYLREVLYKKSRYKIVFYGQAEIFGLGDVVQSSNHINSLHLGKNYFILIKPKNG